MSHRERMKERRKLEAHNLYYAQYPMRTEHDPAHKVISNMFHQQLDAPKPVPKPPQEPLVDNLLRGAYYNSTKHVSELSRPLGLGKVSSTITTGTGHLKRSGTSMSKADVLRYEQAERFRREKLRGGNVDAHEDGDDLLFSGFLPVETRDSSAGPGDANEDWAFEATRAPWSKACCEVGDTPRSAQRVVCGRHVVPTGGQQMFGQADQTFRIAKGAPASVLVNTTSGKQVRHQGSLCTPADMYPKRPFTHGHHDKAVERARGASMQPWSNKQTTTEGISYKAPNDPRPVTSTLSTHRHLDAATLSALLPGRRMPGSQDGQPPPPRRFQSRPRDTITLF